jgi:membrane fusion protein, multidrug efflux system
MLIGRAPRAISDSSVPSKRSVAMETNVAELANEIKRAAPDEQLLSSSEGAPGKLPNPWTRRGLLGGSVAAVLVVALVIHYHNRVTTDDAQVDGHIVPVSSKVYGNVVEVLVNDNQQVKGGQVLLRIDPRDYQVKVDQAKAAVAVAESQARGAQVGVPLTHGVVRSGSSAADAQLAAAQADHERAKLAYEMAAGSDLAYARAQLEEQQAKNERAQADLERMRLLVAKTEISQQEFDAFRATARSEASVLKARENRLASAERNIEVSKAVMLSAKAKVAQARSAVEQAQANLKQVTIRAADASSAEAAVIQARANLAAAQLQLDYTTIVAPVQGVVTRKSVEVGQVVQPGQGLMVLIPLQDIWVTANFKETQLANVHRGQKAEVHVDMYDKTFGGHVDSIAGATGARLSMLPPENATGNYVKVVQRIPVKIVLDPIPPDKAILRPGMNVDATIFTK